MLFSRAAYPLAVSSSNTTRIPAFVVVILELNPGISKRAAALRIRLPFGRAGEF